MCGTEFVPSKFQSGIQLSCSKQCALLRKKLTNKNWKINNRDKVLLDQRLWFKKARLEQPERFRMKVRNRKALRRLTSGSGKTFSTSFTLKDWEEIKESFDNQCALCGIQTKMTIDHIIPLSKGGLHHKSNIQPLCHRCNSGKKDRIDYVPCIRHTVIENPTSNMSVVGTS